MDVFANLPQTLANAGAAADGDTSVYAASCFMLADSGVCLARQGAAKFLCEVAGSRAALDGGLVGDVVQSHDRALKRCALSHENAEVLRQRLPWTAPSSLRERQTTFGCGDRLGRATPGHLRAVCRYDVAPVLAQQSIRELNLTGRTYENVVDDVTFLVLQEGYTAGFGADGDHLKTVDDINVAVDAGMAMITLDLSEIMLAEAEKWTDEDVHRAFAELPAEVRQRVTQSYADRTFDVAGATVTMTQLETERCAVMYLRALDFARDVYDLLRRRRGNAFDLEISIDETQAPTLPEHHLFIIRELQHRQIEISSLAPRFIGEFQKAIDYIGDLNEFERQFIIHCAIAQAHGDYKVSIHSGSDKFSVYPIIGRHTRLRVHVKTAGTSWLEALRALALCSPDLFRELHRKALASFPDALKYYHVTPALDSVPGPDDLPDSELPVLLEQDDARQLLHVTYGGILSDGALAGRFFDALDCGEETYYTVLEKHFVRHLDTLGLTPTA